MQENDFVRFDEWLREEIIFLWRTWESRIFDSTVFHAVRIEEFLLRSHVEQKFGIASKTLFQALELLEPFNVFSREFLWFAHALRRLGNGVRHLTLLRAGQHQAETAAMLLYFFLKRMIQEIQNLSWQNWETFFETWKQLPVFDLYRRLYEHRANEVCLPDPDTKPDSSIFHTATLVSLYAESRIWEGRPESLRHVLNVLEFAIQNLPKHEISRLIQLQSLAYKKTGDIDTAIHVLQTTYGSGKVDDPEAAGILASCWREKWLQTGKKEFLEEAYLQYRHNWKGTQSTYVGINLAATCLYLKKQEESKRLANELLKLLQHQATRLNVAFEDLEPWTLATLAEAALLAGQTEHARILYRQYFSRVHDKPGMANTTRIQLERNLKALGLSGETKSFLPAEWNGECP